MESGWFTFVTTISATGVGIAIGNLSPLLTKKISSRNDRRVALLRLTAPLTGILPLLQTIVVEHAIDRDICLETLAQYSTVAREPSIIEYLNNDEAKWALRTAGLIDLAYQHARKAEWAAVDGDALYRLKVPDASIQRIIMPALWGTTQTLAHLGEMAFVDKNLLPQIADVLNHMGAVARAGLRTPRAERE